MTWYDKLERRFGNVVHMDFEGLLDGVAFKGGTAKDQSVQLCQCHDFLI